MAFVPIIQKYVGVLPLLKAAQRIIEEDFAEALIWRCGLDGSKPGPSFERIQTAQMHSREFPLMVIQPASDSPVQLTGGLDQTITFEVEIFLVRSFNQKNMVDELFEFTADLVRYYEAAKWALQGAKGNRWVQFFPDNSESAFNSATCGEAIFGQLIEGNAQETDGQYERSISFELTIKTTEAEDE